MRLEIGSHVGSYRIDAFIAAGGMGEVYRATHLQLGRVAAIKVLRDYGRSDHVARKRFRREARASSQLDHPNICRVFDFGQVDDSAYIAMEHLDGPNLRDLVKRGPVPVEQAMEICREVARGLDHAHEHGLVHRDLTLGNVIVSDSGPKIVDFGLVKGPIATQEGAAFSNLSESGSVTGTIDFMAPEQLSAEPVDYRVDLYALGVILYWLLEGQPPFRARAQMARVAQILTSAPAPLTRSGLAPGVDHLIHRALQKRPSDRWQSAADMAAALDWLQSEGRMIPNDTDRRLRQRRWAERGLIGAVVAIVAYLAGIARLGIPPDPPSPRYFDVSAPPGMSFYTGIEGASISPDGETVLFTGTDPEDRFAFWVQELSRPTPRRLPGTERAHSPFWAPDSRRFGYVADRRLWVYDLDAGRVDDVAPASTEFRGGTWGNGDVLVYTPHMSEGLFRVALNTPGRERLTTPDRGRGEKSHMWPFFLPDGERFLYYVDSPVDTVRGVYSASLDDPAGVRLMDVPLPAKYGDGHLLFLREGNLFAQPIDSRFRGMTGEPRLVISGVGDLFTLQPTFSVSTTGMLSYERNDERDVTRLARYTPTGDRLGWIGGVAYQRNPRASPDGRRVATDVYASGQRRVHIWELDTGVRRVPPSRHSQEVVWSADSQEVLYASHDQDGWTIFRWRLDSSTEPQAVVTGPDYWAPQDWSPDGRTIIIAQRLANGNSDLLTLSLGDEAGKVTPLYDTAYDEVTARFNPAGDRIAVVSDYEGAMAVYVEPFPVTGRRCPISREGQEPVWGSDGRRLFFRDFEGSVVVADIDPDTGCSVGSPRLAFTSTVSPPGTAREHFDAIWPAGELVLNVPVVPAGSAVTHIVENWPSLIR